MLSGQRNSPGLAGHPGLVLLRPGAELVAIKIPTDKIDLTIRAERELD